MEIAPFLSYMPDLPNAQSPPTCVIQSRAHGFALHAVSYPKPRAYLRLTPYSPPMQPETQQVGHGCPTTADKKNVGHKCPTYKITRRPAADGMTIPVYIHLSARCVCKQGATPKRHAPLFLQ